MPVYLKDIKRDLKADAGKVGKDADGEYLHVPPNIISRDLKDYTKKPVTKVTQVARPGINVLSFSGLVSSETDPGQKHKTTIYFHNMKFKQVESEAFNQKTQVASLTGKDSYVYHRRPSAVGNPITLKCSCQDFRHRFETQLAGAKALIGGPRKYTRKTPAWPIGRPLANATNKLGICKHINSLLLHLKNKGLVQER